MAVVQTCRLYLLLARESPIGAIFRRGPAKLVQLIKWRTDTDTFEPGQWIRGSVNAVQSDLSPTGERLLYAACNYRDGSDTSAIGYAWTAVSNLPYFDPLALWPTSTPALGGGFFEQEDRVRIWYPFDSLKRDPGRGVASGLLFERIWRGTDTPDPKRSARLDREGWKKTRDWKGEFFASALEQATMERFNAEELIDIPTYMLARLSAESGYMTYTPEAREKPDPHGAHALVMRWAIAGYDDVTHFSAKDLSTGVEQPLDGVTWADWDQSGRLVMVADGKLFAGEIGPHGVDRRELADFNRNKFEAIEAPDWAKQW